MAEEIIQPQETIAEIPTGKPVEESQPVESAKPGVEKVGEKPAPQEKPKVTRTYSQEEWEKREAEKDKEAAALRRSLSQISLQKQITDAQEIERQAQSKDRTAVQEGMMTQEAADAASQLRQRQTRLHLGEIQLQTEQEAIAKEKVAREIAKKYGVDVDILLNDDKIQSPADMIDKAANLRHSSYTDRIEKLEAELKTLKEGEPKFDKGQAGGGGELTQEKRLKSRYPSMYKK